MVFTKTEKTGGAALKKGEKFNLGMFVTYQSFAELFLILKETNFAILKKKCFCILGYSWATKWFIFKVHIF